MSEELYRIVKQGGAQPYNPPPAPRASDRLPTPPRNLPPPIPGTHESQRPYNMEPHRPWTQFGSDGEYDEYTVAARWAWCNVDFGAACTRWRAVNPCRSAP